MIKLQIILVSLLTIASLGQCSRKDRAIEPVVKATFTNPVWDGADPWMIKHNNEYIYCFSANNSIIVSRSEKMTKMGELRNIWRAPATGWNRSNVWAPEIHFIGDRWYVYYAAGQSGPPYIHQRSGVLRSKTSDVFSEYEDMGVLYTGDNPADPSSNIWAIDMTVHEHNGKLYALWSGWIRQETTDATPQHLYIAEMENPYTLKGPRVRISSPAESWETGGPLDINEGPEFLKNGENTFIIYSCRESWLVDYRLGMLRLILAQASMLDPLSWKKSGPVFVGNSTVFGVGHASFVKSPDNSEDWIIYHSKKTSSPGWDRDVRMQPFSWKVDGTPYFGNPVPAGQKLLLPAGETE